MQTSDHAIACQTKIAIKQFATRTQKVSGFTNWLFTLGYGVGYKYFNDYLITQGVTFLPDLGTPTLYTCVNEVYLSISNFFTAGTLNCRDLGFYLGQCMAESLEAKTESSVAFVEV